MRDITQVINGIKQCLPSSNEGKLVNEDISNILDSLPWDPPEKINSNHYWNILSNILTKYITQDDYNKKIWCKNVIDIFRDPNYGVSMI